MVSQPYAVVSTPLPSNDKMAAEPCSHGMPGEKPLRQGDQNQRVAAKALAELASGDLSVGTRLATMARSAVLPHMRAVAIEAINSWLASSGGPCIFAGRGTTIAEPRPQFRWRFWAGFAQGVHTPEDREELLRLGSWEAGLDFAWRDELAPALLAGWPHAPEIKAVCLSSVWGPEGGPGARASGPS